MEGRNKIMCKTIEELNAKIKKLEMESENERKRLEEQVIALKKELACIEKAQCSGCRYRTQNACPDT
jgi:hypothetical protein